MAIESRVLRPCCFTVVVFHIAVTRDAMMMSYTTPVRCLWKTVKLTVLIYTLSSKGAELAFIWSHDCGHCLIKLAICPIAIQLGAHPQAVIGKSRTNAFLVQPIGGATNTKNYTFGLHVIEGEYIPKSEVLRSIPLGTYTIVCTLSHFPPFKTPCNVTNADIISSINNPG